MTLTHIFVSHSHADDDWCRCFVDALRALGYDVWYDKEGIAGGALWLPTIQRELQSRDVFIVVLSPQAVASEWVDQEVQLAIASRKHIVPVMHRTASIEGFLGLRQWVDVVGQDCESAVKVVAPYLAPRAAAPAHAHSPVVRRPSRKGIAATVIAGLAVVALVSGLLVQWQRLRASTTTHPGATRTARPTWTPHPITIFEYPLPRSIITPEDLTVGPDGNVWFIDYAGNHVARMTPAGDVTVYPIPTAGSEPEGITSGPDHAVWFTECGGNKIGKVTAQGVITEIPLPTNNSAPDDITVGPDGNLWFTECGGPKIGRLTPSGTLTQFPLPSGDNSAGKIATGPDGAFWFTENSVTPNAIGRVTMSGSVIEYPTDGYPDDIAGGPDGNVWFVEYDGDAIGKITPQGNITQFPLPAPDSRPDGIVGGPDGNLWFTEEYGNVIGRLSPSTGAITEFPLPTAASLPAEITVGPDGTIWFIEEDHRIGKFLP